MPPKKSTITRKKKDTAITSVELVDDAALTTPLPAVDVIPLVVVKVVPPPVVEEQVVPPPVVEEQVVPPPVVVVEKLPVPPPVVVVEKLPVPPPVVVVEKLPVVKEQVVPPPGLEEFFAEKTVRVVDDVVVVVVGDFKEARTMEPDDIRDAAGDDDTAFNFPPPDVIDNKENVDPANKRPEWLKYEQNNSLFDIMRARRTDIQENQFKRVVPAHTLRSMEDSDVEADIGDMI